MSVYSALKLHDLLLVFNVKLSPVAVTRAASCFNRFINHRSALRRVPLLSREIHRARNIYRKHNLNSRLTIQYNVIGIFWNTSEYVCGGTWQMVIEPPPDVHVSQLQMLKYMERGPSSNSDSGSPASYGGKWRKKRMFLLVLFNQHWVFLQTGAQAIVSPRERPPVITEQQFKDSTASVLLAFNKRKFPLTPGSRCTGAYDPPVMWGPPDSAPHYWL